MVYLTLSIFCHPLAQSLQLDFLAAMASFTSCSGLAKAKSFARGDGEIASKGHAVGPSTTQGRQRTATTVRADSRAPQYSRELAELVTEITFVVDLSYVFLRKFTCAFAISLQ